MDLSVDEMFKRAKHILVEEMVMDSLAELSVGITRDNIGIFLLTIGAGGIFTELSTQRVNLLIPATNKEIETAIDTLAISSILDGYRGSPPADKKKIIVAIQAMTQYVKENLSIISEVEVNPLIAGKEEAVAADILLTHIIRESEI